MHPVAAGHDTSITMIERNYSRYIIDHADTWFAAIYALRHSSIVRQLLAGVPV